MKWLLDAQLPRRLAESFVQRGHDATHTLDLPGGNASSDEQLLDVAANEDRVIVTKDADFVNSFWLTESPRQLLLVSTGNIGNRELKELVDRHLDEIIEGFAGHSFLELDRDGLIVHA